MIVRLCQADQCYSSDDARGRAAILRARMRSNWNIIDILHMCVFDGKYFYDAERDLLATAKSIAS